MTVTRVRRKKAQKVTQYLLTCHKKFQVFKKIKSCQKSIGKNLGQCSRGREEDGTPEELTVSQYLKTPVLGRVGTGPGPTRRGPLKNIPLE